MKRIFVKACGTVLAALLLVAAGRAQMNQAPAPSSQPAPPASTATQAAPAQAPAPPPADPVEEAAYKDFMAAHAPDSTRQIQLGEDFAKKYPSSHHLDSVYSAMAIDYLANNDSDKMLAMAQKAIDIDPNNVDALSLTIWGMSRKVDPDTPGAADEYVKLVAYGRHAIELVPTLVKPMGLDDTAFTAAKNDDLAMCYSGLGLIDLKLGNNENAVTEMTEAVQLSASPDPVDLFLLGTAQSAVGHFDDAVATFSKCAVGPMAARCKAGQDDANRQKLTAAPKS